MKEEIKEKLEEEISSELDILKEYNVPSDEYKSTIDGITKLIGILNENDKLEIENDKLNLENRKLDLEDKKHQLNEQVEANKITREKAVSEYNEKDQLFKNLISVGSILIPVLVTVWGTYKTLKFEENGTVTTIMGRGFINKLIPKK